ncbi:MAG: DUF4349 domain-containing protein [Chloroflexota bacterium]|nr:DUF4349 domain-containing protein [Chloroflexota bacterium]
MSDRQATHETSVLLLVSLVALLAAACAAAPAANPAPAAGTPGLAAPGEDADDDDELITGGGPVADAQGEREDGALIVRTGRLQLEVDDIAGRIASATRVVVDLGGYVARSEEQNTASGHSATITFRIPAARWSEALSGLRALAARVIAEHTEALEVTAEVVDLDARIANLRASEAALQEIMNRAGAIEEVLKVQRELTTVRGEIEQLTGRRDHLRDQAAYGTLAVSFESGVMAAATVQEGWQLGAEVDRAVADLIRISQGLASVGIWLSIVVLPVALPVALLLFIAYRLRRRFVPHPPPPTG